MPYRRPFTLTVLLGSILLTAGTLSAADTDFCDALGKIVAAAADDPPFAAVSGPDAGTHFQAAERLPGATWCLVHPDGRPPTFRCLMAGEDRYRLIYQKLTRHADRVAACLGEDQETIEDLYEPYLMQIGFLKRTARSRVATSRAYEHLGIKGQSKQKELFNK